MYLPGSWILWNVQVGGHVLIDAILCVDPRLGPGAFLVFFGIYVLFCVVSCIWNVLRTIGDYSWEDSCCLEEDAIFLLKWLPL